SLTLSASSQPTTLDSPQATNGLAAWPRASDHLRLITKTSYDALFRLWRETRLRALRKIQLADKAAIFIRSEIQTTVNALYQLTRDIEPDPAAAPPRMTHEELTELSNVALKAAPVIRHAHS